VSSKKWVLALAASHQQLSALETEQRKKLEQALAMQKEADLRMEQAALAGKVRFFLCPLSSVLLMCVFV
jgi:hypothetical protein